MMGGPIPIEAWSSVKRGFKSMLSLIQTGGPTGIAWVAVLLFGGCRQRVFNNSFRERYGKRCSMNPCWVGGSMWSGTHHTHEVTLSNQGTSTASSCVNQPPDQGDYISIIIVAIGVEESLFHENHINVNKEHFKPQLLDVQDVKRHQLILTKEKLNSTNNI